MNLRIFIQQEILFYFSVSLIKILPIRLVCLKLHYEENWLKFIIKNKLFWKFGFIYSSKI